MSFLSELRSQRARASRLLVFICGTTTLLLGWPTPPAAGFIGGDGLIAFDYVQVDDTVRDDHDIYVVEKDGTGRTQLTNNEVDDTDPTWSPDGGRLIAFVRGNPLAGDRDIWLMSADGSETSKLIGGRKQQFAPAWSPTGAHLLYVQRADEKSAGKLWIARADGKQRRRFDLGQRSVMSASWSPRANKIAFTAARRRGRIAVLTMNFDGTNVKRLAIVFHASIPQWSPDGRELLVTNDRGYIEILRMDSDGSDLRLFGSYPGAGDLVSPTWSPSGRERAYVFEGDTGSCGSDTELRIGSSYGIDERGMLSECVDEAIMNNLDWQPLCTVEGSDGPDFLQNESRNTAGGELLCGGDGPDHLSAGHNGVAFGGPGNDSLYGRIANGGPGGSLLEGLPLVVDDDILHGHFGRQFLVDLTGNDRLYGAYDNDVLNTADGEPGDELYGEEDRDLCIADRGDERSGCEKNRRDLIRR